MANSKYDYHKENEELRDHRFDPDFYIIVRIDGHNFHRLCSDHNFGKPNDKRSLDLMIHSAKTLMKTYRGHIPLAYGHSDEFSFLIKSTSDLLKRREYKITSMLPSIFTASYNNNWEKFFGDPNRGPVECRKYDVWFDAKPMEYPNRQSVIDYFRWRQVDCHINNLYNTTLHCLTGRYVKHELVPLHVHPEQLDDGKIFTDGSGSDNLFTLKKTPITEWISDASRFRTSKLATAELKNTIKDQKYEIMSNYGVDYDQELDQFKKGTILVDTKLGGGDTDSELIKHFHIDFTASSNFWTQNSHIFSDRPLVCAPVID